MNSPAHLCTRRCLIAGALACSLVPLVRAEADEPAEHAAARKARPQAGDVLVHADGEYRGQCVRADTLVEGAAPVSAWPMHAASSVVRDASRLNQVRLLRLLPSTLSERARPNAANGIVAYAGMCTHAGCDVAGWSAETQHLLCPCHSSEFDARDAGTVIKGPAPRPLAMLPLRLEQRADVQQLVVARGFTRPVGFKPA